MGFSLSVNKQDLLFGQLFVKEILNNEPLFNDAFIEQLTIRLEASSASTSVKVIICCKPGCLSSQWVVRVVRFLAEMPSCHIPCKFNCCHSVDVYKLNLSQYILLFLLNVNQFYACCLKNCATTNSQILVISFHFI